MKYITIKSRLGHYNFCDTSEESISTNITLWEYGNIVPIKSMSITTDDEIEDTDFNPEDIALEIIDLLKAEDKRYIFTTNRENILGMIKLIEESSNDIPQGQKQYLLDSLVKERERVIEQLNKLDKRIGELI